MFKKYLYTESIKEKSRKNQEITELLLLNKEPSKIPSIHRIRPINITSPLIKIID